MTDATKPLYVPARTRPGVYRWFFAGYGVWLLLIALAGFSGSYSAALAGEFTIPVTGHIHGVVMTAWLGLFIWQATLASLGDVAAHRRWGPRIALYAIIVWLSLWIATASALLRFDETVMTFLYDVLLAQFILIILFPILFIWGLLERGRLDRHRRLMALATAVLVQAGIDRIGWLPDYGLPGFAPNTVNFFLLCVTPIVVFDFAGIRRLHNTTILALIVIALVHAGANMLWGSDTWRPIAVTITEIVR
jgi:hypothetical protein